MLRRAPLWGLALIAGLVFPLGLAPFDFWPIISLSAGLLYALLSQPGQFPRAQG